MVFNLAKTLLKLEQRKIWDLLESVWDFPTEHNVLTAASSQANNCRAHTVVHAGNSPPYNLFHVACKNDLFVHHCSLYMYTVYVHRKFQLGRAEILSFCYYVHEGFELRDIPSASCTTVTARNKNSRRDRGHTKRGNNSPKSCKVSQTKTHRANIERDGDKFSQ